jgi:osmotically-inducible protein OsmY
MSLCVSVIPNQSVSLTVRDPSLGDRVREGLTSSPYLAVRRVNVEEQEGVLTLSGRLPNFYLKQMAQSSVSKVEGVRSIINRIDVVDPGTTF